MIPLLLVVIVLSSLFYSITLFGGVISELDRNSESVLQERVQNKETDIGTLFSTRWTNFDDPVNNMNSAVSNITGGDSRALVGNDDYQRQVLSTTYPQLVTALRQNAVTGVFVILNNSNDYSGYDSAADQRYYGMCIRDYDPNSDYTDKEDLLVARCPSSLVGMIGCSVDTNWEATYSFDEQDNGDYYYKPLEQAFLNPGANVDNLAYLSKPHSFAQNDRQVISYSIPLVDSNGHPYGVLGIELTVDYLKSLVPASSLYTQEDSCYALVQYEEGQNDYEVIASSGTLVQRAFGANTSFSTEEPNSGGVFTCLGTKNNLDLRGNLAQVEIYNSNTPFENEHLGVVALVRAEALYSVSSTVRRDLVLISLVVLLFGVVAAHLITRHLTKPITQLSEKVRSMDEDSLPQLDTLGITEIDDLVIAIEDLSDKINRNMVRSEFFSRMSHDMRTPMNAIIGFSLPEITANATPDQLRDYMDKIHSSGTFLLGLINEVLDMTKIESKRMELRLERLRNSCLWDDVIPIIDEVAKDTGVSFKVETAVDDTVVMVDRQRVDQILMNLLSNAVKFTPSGGTVEYKVTQTDVSESTSSFEIIVRDTGRGMSPEFMKDMYTPFSQELSGPMGTGLGLAITKQLISLMKGTINCTSELGKGTTFTVRLSFAHAEDSSNTEDSEDVSKAQASLADPMEVLKGKHVLLCEDNPINAEIATMLLERKGMIIEQAKDGKQGVTMFEDSPSGYYDAVLMDIRMPVMDGLQAASAIRALNRPDASHIPIIAMTANAFAEDVAKSRSAGMDDHLSKPIDPTILFVTLSRYLSS